MIHNIIAGVLGLIGGVVAIIWWLTAAFSPSLNDSIVFGTILPLTAPFFICFGIYKMFSLVPHQSFTWVPYMIILATYVLGLVIMISYYRTT